MKDLPVIIYENIPPRASNAHGLSDYVNELRMLVSQNSEEYPLHEHLLKLPRDQRVLALTEEAAARYRSDRLKYVIVIGIGWSNLGAKAVYDAMRGVLGELTTASPKLLFADTVSSSLLSNMTEFLEHHVTHADELVINLISKSGTTTESIVNFEILYRSLAEKFPDIASRIVVTTDHGSRLWNEGERLGFGLLPIPNEVGGRYSVFSAVGLFPLLLAGIDIMELRAGGSAMLEQCILDNISLNPALIAAQTIHAAHQEGATIHNLFLFNPELESLGKWERQLIAESLGKECDLSGAVVRAGITPIVSIGSTDLHSMAQLYFGGPRDKFTTIVQADAPRQPRVSDQEVLHELVSGLSGKSPSDIMQAIVSGVRVAYKKNKLPVALVRLSEISPYTLGAYLLWRMATVMYLAKLMRVNAFDQPNVEDYKIATREFLEEHQ